MNDEFHVGYLDRCPPRTAAFLRRWLAGVTGAVLVGLALAGARQAPLGNGSFEFGVLRDYEGILLEEPLPLLHQIGRDGTSTNLVLVGAGKRGLPEFARGHHGHRVRLRGTAIERDGRRMVELAGPESFAVLEDPPVKVAATGDLGAVELVGELVDTKCWFGVMRPAVGKVHRACAIRCLSGGVPPGLLIRQPDGSGVVVMLATPPAGERLDPRWAGRVLRVRGRLGTEAGLPVLRVETAGLVRGPAWR